MQNEILKPVLETDEVAVPRYDIVGPNGSVIQQNVELRLKNEVVQEGTPYDEESVLPASLCTQLSLDPKTATPAEAMLALLVKGGGAVRRNRPPTSADAEQVGKLWVIPKMTFHNLMPDALAQVGDNWQPVAAITTVADDSATFTGDGTAQTINAQVSMLGQGVAGHTVFVHADVTVNHDANAVSLSLMCGDTVLISETLQVPAAGDVLQIRSAATVQTDGDLMLQVQSTYNTSVVQLDKSITASAITVWDLTADQCEAQEGNEFTVDEAVAYLSTFGNFQTREYEYSTFLWVLRGVTAGAYLWTSLEVYTKPETLDTDVRATLGLAADAVPLDALRTLSAAFGLHAIQVDIITTSGNWTAPTGLIGPVKAYIFGGGGGGGGGTTSARGGGGGGGGHLTIAEYDVAPGEVVACTIGAGGAGGAMDANGKSGGASTFGDYGSASGGSYGYNNGNGGAGGSGGGGGGVSSGTNGTGGKGSYGGGGGGGARGEGGAGGTYGGGGGSGGAGSGGGAAGTYGGAGGAKATAGKAGQPYAGYSITDLLLFGLTNVLPSKFLASGGKTGTSTIYAYGGGGGGGFGGLGGAGGHMYDSTSYPGGGGGGGGYAADGANATSNSDGMYGGGGGGGGFGPGGVGGTTSVSSNYIYGSGGGGGGIKLNDTVYAKGGSGGRAGNGSSYPGQSGSAGTQGVIVLFSKRRFVS